ncbi:Kunitz/Bovine pancreatic trypsin inhibitor domain protein, partial [Teladorsagia circumcincta]
TYRPPSNRDRCFQPHDPGQCNGDFERWYFDANKRQCVCSWWSGCGGNSNLFYSYKHCMLICGEFAVAGAGVDDRYMNRTYTIGGRAGTSPGMRTHTETTMIWYHPAYPPYSGPVQAPQQIVQRPGPQVTFIHQGHPQPQPDRVQVQYPQPQPDRGQVQHPQPQPDRGHVQHGYAPSAEGYGRPQQPQQAQYPQGQYQQVQYPQGQYQLEQQQYQQQRQQV